MLRNRWRPAIVSGFPWLHQPATWWIDHCGGHDRDRRHRTPGIVSDTSTRSEVARTVDQAIVCHAQELQPVSANPRQETDHDQVGSDFSGTRKEARDGSEGTRSGPGFRRRCACIQWNSRGRAGAGGLEQSGDAVRRALEKSRRLKCRPTLLIAASLMKGDGALIRGLDQ